MSSELKKRILFTLLVLFIYRLGTFIPLPGIDGKIIEEFFSNNNNSVFGMLNMFSGGAFQRMSIFALNIMPYITASIIIQLLGSVYKGLEELRKEGEAGRRKLNQYTKYLTLFLGFFQSVGVYFAFSNLEQSAFLSDSKLFLWTTVFSLLGSTMLLTWLGDKITHQGIGNGISILIFTGIVSELPSNITNIIEASKKAEYSYLFFTLLILLSIALVIFVVYMEKAVRNVRMQYSNSRGFLTNQKDVSYIPMKINVSGVIPPIFASSILTFPLILLQFFASDETVNKFSSLLSRGGVLYIILFSICVVFFSFFYSTIVFNTEELSDNLKKGGCFVPGVRPGNSTKEFFDRVLSRLTLIGSLYLFVVCIIPDVLFTKYSISLTIGGTSLLIIVSTVIEIVTRVQSYILSDKYGNVNKRRRIRVSWYNMFNIIILGPAGSGKGIQSELLSGAFNIPHISTGKMLRDISNSDGENSNLVKDSIENGSLVSNELMFDILLRRLKKEDCKNGFILDGFPRNFEQAVWLSKNISGINDKELVIVVLDVPFDVLLKRITGRYNCKKCGAIYNRFYENTKVENVCDRCGSNEFFVREDDSDVESIKKRLDIYRNMSKSIVDFYDKKNLIYFINGVDSVENIHANIKSSLIK